MQTSCISAIQVSLEFAFLRCKTWIVSVLVAVFGHSLSVPFHCQRNCVVGFISFILLILPIFLVFVKHTQHQHTRFIGLFLFLGFSVFCQTIVQFRPNVICFSPEVCDSHDFLFLSISATCHHGGNEAPPFFEQFVAECPSFHVLRGHHTFAKQP